MSIDPGQLDQRITLQPRVASVDGSGQNNYSFAAGVPVWARAVPTRGQEQVAASQVQAVGDCVFLIRHRADVDATWRVLWRDEPYAIVAPPIDPYGGRQWLELACKQGVGDGAPRHGEDLTP